MNDTDLINDLILKTEELFLGNGGQDNLTLMVKYYTSARSYESTLNSLALDPGIGKKGIGSLFSQKNYLHFTMSMLVSPFASQSGIWAKLETSLKSTIRRRGS